MNNRQIVLKKVKVHNLKNVDLTLNPFEIIVFTGVSGSGKSSLAFDTIFVEGQRRYIESLSHSAKRYLNEMSKPDVQTISGLSPTIAIEQKTVLKTPRSTVGTITGIYDFLRVLFAKVATAYCPISGEAIKTQSREKILKSIELQYKNKKIFILSPYINNKKSSFKEEFLDLQKKGYSRIRVDKKIYILDEITPLDPKKSHSLDIVIDRLEVSENNLSRLKESVNLSMEVSKGSVIIVEAKSNEEKYYSEHGFSKKSNTSYPPLTIQDFSFNHPSGMCPKCQGLGEVFEFDLEKIIDPNLSISEDCCKIAGHYNTVRYKNIYENLAKLYKFSTKTAWKDLSEKAKKILLYGTDTKWTKMRFIHLRKKIKWTEYVSWKGILFEAHKRLNEAKSDIYRKNIQSLMSQMTCPSCNGSRIKKYPSAAKLDNLTISKITQLNAEKCLQFFEQIKLEKEELFIAKDLLIEIKKKLKFLINVGLQYLTIDRISPTLSGGESQRVRLASQLGCSLSGATYILDEPSIGLHPFDHNKLIGTLIDLKNAKNTVIIVEHDKDTIESADQIVDIGPYAGKIGGEIIAQGSIDDIIKSKRSITGKYFSHQKTISLNKYRKISSKKITLTQASLNNLKNVDITIPTKAFICITGVSGSGKSSLISDTFFPAISNILQKSTLNCGKYKNISGLENIKKIIFVDQAPIGRTIRSNPATYIKLFDDIRLFFSNLPKSKMKGFTPSHFSFNVKEGTCPYCKGLGKVKIDMDFLEDVFSTCHQCHGKRFDPDILSVTYKDKSIFDVLEMDVDEALDIFVNIPQIKKKLHVLQKVGLGYMPIGQSATTLSGGEAQRIKLAKELVRPSGDTLYILDEPTTGLHFHDIEKLLQILQELVDHNNTVLVIEHNMDFVKNADYIIDMGPGAGTDGGKIIFQGAFKDILSKKTKTAIYLNKALKETRYIQKKPKQLKKYPQEIIIENAYQNNLKNINLKIPHGQMTVFTGPSGSGKTSLAFDTIYAEGQIRYMEALPSYTRQFLKQIPRPNIDKIDNLFPCIALEQKGHLLSPRSTVGTITEIYDHLRLLYSHLGIAYCPETHEKIKTISKDFVVDKVLSYKEGEKIQILSPIEIENDSFEDLLQKYIAKGFLRIRINNAYYEIDEKIPFDTSIKNKIYLVIDRLKVAKNIKARLFEAVKTAADISDGKIIIAKEKEDVFFNLSFAVESTGKSYPKITPQSFSFNSEKGMCLDCQGLGYNYGFDILSNSEFLDSAIEDIAYIFFDDNELELINDYFSSININTEIPLKDLSTKELNIFLYGFEKPYKYKKNFSFIWKGINKTLATLARHSLGHIKESLYFYMEKNTCSTCAGQRLNPLSQNVLINKLSIVDLCALSIKDASEFIKSIKLTDAQKPILSDTLQEIQNHLGFLLEIGLDYLSLDRSAPTLSGGEMQRIRLSKQLGSFLTSCIYILDEPTIGLHPHNSYLLVNALKKLKNLGNTLILVEHDPIIIKKADYIYDFGPQAGEEGGKITAHGSLKEILKNPKSLTGNYLSNKKQIPIPAARRNIANKPLTIKNACLHNLKNISVALPINAITCISGVSGSGKSTLINQILKPAATLGLKQNKDEVKYPYAKIKGIKNFEKLIVLDQSPIGQTKRADVGTYSDIMPHIRSFYSNMKLAKAKGLKPRHFSYNHIQGMCRNCWGIGYKNITLSYLPPVRVKCDVCHGQKLNPRSLEVKYKNKSLGDVLDLTINEALEFFEVVPQIVKKLNILIDTGLGYLKLGQELSSLSGGEAQRIRLSKELAKRSLKNNLYLLDEPSIGLHSIDIEKLLKIFHKLADKNNTLIIIEHNLDIIANADYIIDLGPDAGEKGGEVITSKPPEEFIKEQSYTAKYLKEILKNSHIR